MKNKAINLKIIMLVMGLLLLATSFFTTQRFVSASNSQDSNIVVDTIVTENNVISMNYLDFVICVDENGIIDVSQTFEVTFNKVNLTEIVYFLPYAGNIIRYENGKMTETPYLAKVFDYSMVKLQEGNEELRIYYDEVGSSITFGIKNPTDNYNLGDTRAYTIKYKYDMKNTGTDDYDEVYFNLLGFDSDMPIKNITFDITFPKSIDFETNPIYFYYGKADTQTFDFVDYKIIGNNRVVSSQAFNLDSNTAFTFRQMLPKGYINVTPREFKWEILAIIIASVYFVLAIVIKIIKEPRNRFVETVEVNAIKGLGPLSTEFYDKYYITNKSFGAMIVWFASNGYIGIETNNDEKKTITKIKKLANFVPTGEINEEIEYKEMFDDLFAVSNEIDFDDLEDNEAINKFIKLKRKSAAKKSDLYEKSNKLLKAIMCIMSVLSLVATIFFSCKASLFHLGFISMHYHINYIFIFINTVLAVLTFYGTKKKTSANQWKAYINCCVVFGFTMAFSFNMLIAVPGINLLKIALILSILSLVFLPSNPIKPEYLTISGRVKGFKKYINMVEKDRIEKLVYYDPKVFYKILPYAYVLGVSDVWIKKFEDIQISSILTEDYAGDIFIFNLLFTKSSGVVGRVEGPSGYGGSSSSGGSGGGSSGGGGGGGSFGAR